MKTYRRLELTQLDTIEQDHYGDELKIKEDGYRVWLTLRENRPWNGDYTVEVYDQESGMWEQFTQYFD